MRRLRLRVRDFLNTVVHARERAPFLAGKHDCGHSSFSKDNSASFLVKKKCNEAFRGVCTLRIRKKNSVKSRTLSRCRPRI